jgi:hypothetical protein
VECSWFTRGRIGNALKIEGIVDLLLKVADEWVAAAGRELGLRCGGAFGAAVVATIEKRIAPIPRPPAREKQQQGEQQAESAAAKSKDKKQELLRAHWVTSDWSAADTGVVASLAFFLLRRFL